jgi:uncharacterized protein involved in type VI secretion and phage assembly
VRALETGRDVVVALDGAALEPPALAALTQVRVRQGLSTPTQCELTFAGTPGALPPAALRLAAPLRVVLAGFDTALFDGEVTAIQQVVTADQGREVRVRAYDRSHRLRKRQRVRMHV